MKFKIMNTLLIFIGVFIGCIVLLEIHRHYTNKPAKNEKVDQQKVDLPITLQPMRGQDGNYSGKKRINENLEILIFKGDSYTIKDDQYFIELYVYISISNKLKRFHLNSRHMTHKQLEAIIHLFN